MTPAFAGRSKHRPAKSDAVHGGWSGAERGPARLGVRSRVALVAALAVAVAVISSSAIAFVAVRRDLLDRVDATLAHRASSLAKRRATQSLAAVVRAPRRQAAAIGLPAGPFVQVVAATGAVVAREELSITLPVNATVRRVAASKSPRYFASVTVGTTPVRMLVTPFGTGFALEVVEPISELELELERLAAVLGVTAAGGVLLAILLGAGVAGVALRPVRRLTVAAERLAATSDLAQEIRVEGRDELSRLAASINTVLAALKRSQQAQRQLVADASHELRTPLTSLRTNVEVLASVTDLDPIARRQLVEDLAAELDSLSRLIGDLIELARQEATPSSEGSIEVLALDELVSETLSRGMRGYPRVRFERDLSPVLVRGVQRDLERLAANLIDNAAKWSPEAGVVEISLRTGGDDVVLSVRDHGPGIATEDLPHVFDRFYRGGSPGHVTGSGLGLAIVRRIVEAHGGSVGIEAVEGGGTCVVVHLPRHEQPGEP